VQLPTFKQTFLATVTSLLSLALLSSMAFCQAPKVATVVPEWIWSNGKPADNEVAFFRKIFVLDGAVKKAALAASGDNGIKVYVNGKEVGESGDWSSPVKVDIAKHLIAGTNVLAIRGKNADGIAALVAQLDITAADGKTLSIATDKTWLVSAAEAKDWNTAGFDTAKWIEPHSFGKLGIPPWGNVLTGQASGSGAGPNQAAIPGEKLELLPGFKGELLYSVPKGEQGSWVSMTFDDKGRIIACDQGGPLYRVTLAKGSEPLKVEKLDVKIGQAQGLLHTFGSLYVTVNGSAAQGSGLYKVSDTNGDDQYDEVKLLKKFNGGGEHGPHGVVRGPDDKLYVVAGNFTKPPQDLVPNSPFRNYAQDQVLPQQPDGNGHDGPGQPAPGGWICRTDKDGKDWEFFCGGFRNSYDIAFNQDGELFTYDSDMEWDTGVAWYRPTRANHCVSAAEFGWRYGTGKWPSYYADSLGAYDIGMGSPTGVTVGTGAKFPAKYQRALFVLDWTYGKLYAMHLTPKGASYAATFEPFVIGKPLPLTDAAIGPDGALYFTIGGRGTQSGLYRVSYEGTESTAPVGALVDAKASEARAARRMLEAFHIQKNAGAVADAWPYLDSPDRHLRYAARVAIENQDVAQWRAKALAETRTTASIYALIALTRTGTKEDLKPVLDALGKLKLDTLSVDQQLDLLRAYGLAFIRLGPADAGTKSEIAARLEAYYPSPVDFVNRELCTLLVYCDSPAVVKKSMELLSAALTQEEQVHYVFTLRLAKAGWNLDLRKAYFSWFNLANKSYQGGASFKRFLENIRKEAVATLSESEKVELKSVLDGQQSVQVVLDEKPRKFIHNWQMQDLIPLLSQLDKGRNFERGKAAYKAAQCARCHRFKSEGEGVGHDLTGVGNRFSAHDLLESVVLPSKVVSDQYASKTVVTTKGRTITGLVAQQADGGVEVMQSNFQRVQIPKAEIEEIVPTTISTMPEGLISILTKDEVLDLVAYLRAGGNAEDKAFQK